MTNRTILVVDDNSNDIFLTKRALKKSHINDQIVLAHDGLDALDFLFGAGLYSNRDLSKMPALTLLDLKMPGADGLEVLRKIRSSPLTRFLPVVMLTSSAEESDIQACYRCGCNAYICKPVDFNQFLELIGHLCALWLTFNKLPLFNHR
jgi:two-component system, response regulator